MIKELAPLVIIAFVLFMLMPKDFKIMIGGGFLVEKKKRKITRRESLDMLYRDYDAPAYSQAEQARKDQLKLSDRAADLRNHQENTLAGMFHGGASLSDCEKYKENHNL